MLIFSLLISVLAAFAIWLFAIGFRIMRLKHTYRELVEKLRELEVAKISSVAYEARSASHDTRKLLQQLGGIEALERFRQRADAMIDLARYLSLVQPEQRWFARQLRRDAARVRRIAILLSLQSRLRPASRFSVASAYDLVEHYASAARYSSTACALVIDGVAPLVEFLTEPLDVQERNLLISDNSVPQKWLF